MTSGNGKIHDDAEERKERLAAFVADLERLRREAGQPSLRKMSETGHYSHTALSSVLSGTRLPSRELTLAFVRACGGDENTWQARWQRENAALHPTPAPPANGRPAPRRTRGSFWAAGAAIAAAVATAVALAVTFGPWRAGSERTPAAPPTADGGLAAADGADPQQERCQLDAMNAATVEVGGPDRYGSLTLRYSPRCRAAWPLFVSTERVPTGAVIHLETTRPSDGAVSEFDYPYLVDEQVYSVFGNVLQTTKGCVSVAVDVRAADTRTSLALADTPCLTLTGSGG
jgi:hypothetical protein